LLELVATLARMGVAVPEIVTSGTPTLKPALDYAPFRAANGPRHRISPAPSSSTICGRRARRPSCRSRRQPSCSRAS